MRVFLVLLALLCACHRPAQRKAEQRHWDSVAAGPRWVRVDSSKHGDVFSFDHEGVIRFDSAQFLMWWQATYKNMGTRAERLEVNCSARETRLLESVVKDSAAGIVVNQSVPNDSLKWWSVAPNSEGDRVLVASCAYAESRNLPIVRR